MLFSLNVVDPDLILVLLQMFDFIQQQVFALLQFQHLLFQRRILPVQLFELFFYSGMFLFIIY